MPHNSHAEVLPLLLQTQIHLDPIQSCCTISDSDHAQEAAEDKGYGSNENGLQANLGHTQTWKLRVKS